MDTLHSVLNRGCSIWDRSRLPVDEFQQRLHRVRSAMEERSLDLLLVYGDSWKWGNLAYVSHFLPKNRGAMAILPRAGDPALVVQEPSRNNSFSRTLTWIPEVHSVGQFAQGLAQTLRARGLQPKRVGLVTVEEQLGARQWHALMEEWEGVEKINCGELVRSLRLVKSHREVALIRKSAEILSSVLTLLKEEMRPGQKEYELMALAEREARGQGAEDFRFLIGRSSEPEVGLRPVGATPIEGREGILVSMAMSFQRYWAEVGRTFYLGGPPGEALEGYRKTTRLFLRLREGLKPGVGTGRAGTWLEELFPSPAERESALAYGLGNGVGLDLVEEPVLGKEGGPEIREGMVLTLRVCLQGKGCGSALLASPYRVTPSGLESLGDAGADMEGPG